MSCASSTASGVDTRFATAVHDRQAEPTRSLAPAAGRSRFLHAAALRRAGSSESCSARGEHDTSRPSRGEPIGAQARVARTKRSARAGARAGPHRESNWPSGSVLEARPFRRVCVTQIRATNLSLGPFVQPVGAVEYWSSRNTRGDAAARYVSPYHGTGSDDRVAAYLTTFQDHDSDAEPYVITDLDVGR